MSSFLKVIDTGLKVLCWDRFYEDLSFSSSDDYNDNIVFEPQSIAMRRIAEKRGHDRVGFFSLWRVSTKVSERSQTSIAKHGVSSIYVDEATKESVNTIKAVAADLVYNFHVYSKNLDYVNNVIENYLFWKYENPYLALDFNDTYPINLQMFFGGITDESDLSEIYNIGRYYVANLPIQVEGWIPKISVVNTIKTIYLKIYDYDGVTTTTTEFLENPDDDFLLASDTIDENS